MPSGALLDVDGTLLDTNHLHAVAWWRGLRRCGVTVPMQRIHQAIGMGGDLLVPHVAGREVPGASDAWREEIEVLLPEVVALPGARRLVRGLHERGRVVVLATSSPSEHLARFREVLDVDDELHAATTADDVDDAKPAPDIFEAAMAEVDLEPPRTVAIGDTIWDARAARRAGVAFVGVESGGWRGRELADEGAVATYADVGEIADDLDAAGWLP